MYRLCTINTREIIDAMDNLLKCVDYIEELHILGGEPFLNKDIYKILQYVRKLDFEEEKLQMYLDLNKLILTSFKDRDDISIIDTNDFLHGTNDITDSIMHYVRRIYYNIAQKINCFVK